MDIIDNNWSAYVNDLEQFINTLRIATFNNFLECKKSKFTISIQNSKKLDQILPYNECYSIAINTLYKKDDDFYLNSTILKDLLLQFKIRMASNIVQDLSNKGLINCGYDIENNKFVFWIKD
jgi:hypothetical protein